MNRTTCTYTQYARTCSFKQSGFKQSARFYNGLGEQLDKLYSNQPLSIQFCLR